jgi:hypothetical protein
MSNPTPRNPARYALTWLLALCAAWGLLLPASGGAEETPKLWAAVIVGALAKDEPKETAEELEEFQAQLHSIFGYERYRIAGQFTEPLSTKDFEVKTKHFSMQLTYMGEKPSKKKGEPPVHDFQLKLFQKGDLIVQAEVEAPPGKPFYVRGPVWGSKEIILMILVR